MKYSNLPRIYIEGNIKQEDKILLSGEYKNYIMNVMRMKDGFKIRVFNQDEGEYYAKIHYDNKDIILEICDKIRDSIKIPKKISLLMSIIKPEKFEATIDMAVQIGVAEIIPIITDRVQKRAINIERVRKIIFEATRQSERLDIAKLRDAARLVGVDFAKFDVVYFANEAEERTLAVENSPDSSSIAVLIGPEGGFSDHEVSLLRSITNVKSISLGQNVLRSETAAIVALSKIIL